MHAASLHACTRVPESCARVCVCICVHGIRVRQQSAADAGFTTARGVLLAMARVLIPSEKLKALDTPVDDLGNSELVRLLLELKELVDGVHARGMYARTHTCMHTLTHTHTHARRGR